MGLHVFVAALHYLSVVSICWRGLGGSFEAFWGTSPECLALSVLGWMVYIFILLMHLLSIY